MATQKEMYELIGRAVVDADFRKKLMANPETATKDAGYTLTPEQMRQVKDSQGKGIAAILEERLSKVSFIFGS